MMLWMFLGSAIAVAFLALRKRVHRAYRSWRAAAAGRTICRWCDHEIDEAWCHCGSAVEQHTAYSGHSPVPMGCRCHEDRGEEIPA